MKLGVEIRNIEVFREISDQFPKVGDRALTRVANSAKTHASKLIRQEYNIKKSDLDERFNVRPSFGGRLIARIVATGRPFSLTKFGAKQLKSGIITVAIKKGQRKIFKGKRELLGKPFINEVGKARHRGVFQRVGREQIPIVEAKTIGVPEMFGSRKIMGDIREFINDKLPTEFYRQLKYFLSLKGR